MYRKEIHYGDSAQAGKRSSLVVSASDKNMSQSVRLSLMYPSPSVRLSEKLGSSLSKYCPK